MNDFEGLPPALFEFFAALEQNNTRQYWEANKHVWDDVVRTPVKALLMELEGEFPPLRLFRPNRDLRFSRDKSPYKLFTGATSDVRAIGGVGYHLRVDADGLTLGCGAMLMSTDELQRFRAAIDDEESGGEFSDLVATLSARTLTVSPGLKPALKKVPPGYPGDHPRTVFLRWKGAAMVTESEMSEWMHTPVAADRIRQTWRAAQPLMEWLTAYVEDNVRSR